MFGGKLRHPFRLYANNEGTICVIVCETPILVQGIHRVLDEVMKWALEQRYQCACFGGHTNARYPRF